MVWSGTDRRAPRRAREVAEMNAEATLSANPASVEPGQPTTLTWTAKNAISCSIDNGIGDVGPTGGSHVVTPRTTTKYKLTCHGARGIPDATAEALVEVNAAEVKTPAQEGTPAAKKGEATPAVPKPATTTGPGQPNISSATTGSVPESSPESVKK